MQTESLDFADDDALTGFRLQHIEVLNWGTFDRVVWRIDPAGKNALLTGDIGSGKSTLVDAITTLLVPAHRIIYNKAAGAENKERSLISYVKGYYKSEKDDTRLTAKAVALRDQNSYSVVLGYFYNQGYDLGVTLAQVFWIKDNKTQPERFYLIADTPLSIAEHFSHFGNEMLDLKKRLRHHPRVTLFNSFSQYAGEFRRRLGIQSEQAMELFYQTVSMKSVGNLTDFVRLHMLEACDVQQRIGDMCRNFDNLNQAHAAVLKAKAQIGSLTPLVENCDQYQTLEQNIKGMTACRDMLYAYFAHHKAHLLQERIGKREQQLARLKDKLAAGKNTLAGLRQQETGLRRSIADNGGNRLEDIEREIHGLQDQRQTKAALAEHYRVYCRQLDLPQAEDGDAFHRNRQQAQTLLGELENGREQVRQLQIDAKIELRQLNEQHQQLEQEILSLKQRKSNIPLKNLQLRQQLCDTLELQEDALPFAGELLQIHEEAADWQGAIERVMHNFALSLLVTEEYYLQVAHYVEQTHLRGRLVYFRTRDEHHNRKNENPDAQSLQHKLSIQPDSPFFPWLQHELDRRFDYACCDSLEEFRHQPKALTRSGQIKSNQKRHEKDDRFAITDRSRYVLGWDNREKIQALQDQQTRLAQQGDDCLQRLETLSQKLKALEQDRDALRDLLKIASHNDIHWQALAQQIQTLKQEQQEIQRGSDILRALQDQLGKLLTQLSDTEERYDQQREQVIRTESLLDLDRQQLREAEDTLNSKNQKQREVLFPKLGELQAKALGDQNLTVENCDKRQTQMREWLQARLDSAAGKSKHLASKITGQMQVFKTDYPQETLEFDADLDAANEYRAILQQLQSEDLPRHEQRFKTLLNEGTIQDIAMLQSRLDKERQEILDKIELINQSLREIEYNPGSYIELVPDHSQDPEIRQFQQDLRSCLGDTLSGNDNELYSEHKFHQVKELIDRFNGREGLTDLDKKWTRKVSDVRNWFNFSASERWLEDGSEKEFYSDSAGKSGGQKEKLAYTILASALAYQFGLKWGDTRSRSFRFVMIDEAFGRGSDESARYGLELFKKLNLQLLIVTPLQKIHVIEDYIHSVHFVHNEDGCNSKIRNLSIEAYREEKAAFQSAGSG
jgi:uncharacterized protein YPO0396